MTREHWNAILGLGCMAFALVTLLLWIPSGVETGVIEEVRRQTVIGDTMAPAVWSIGLGLLGALLAASSLMKLREGSAGAPTGGPTWANMRYLALLLVIVLGALVLMMVAGPAVVKVAQALGSEVDNYRAMRATRPWKYIGYLAGGFVMIFGLMTTIARQLSWRLALIAAAAVVVMALAYDLPFKNLLLPPNGDQ